VAQQVQVADSTGTVVRTFRSDKAGHFRVRLAPGTYTLTAHAPRLPRLEPVTVRIIANQTTTTRLLFDTGIR
jgi:hypothetical protein